MLAERAQNSQHDIAFQGNIRPAMRFQATPGMQSLQGRCIRTSGGGGGGGGGERGGKHKVAEDVATVENVASMVRLQGQGMEREQDGGCVLEPSCGWQQ